MWPFTKKIEIKAQNYVTNIEDFERVSYIDSLSGLSSGYPTEIQPREAYFLSERNSDLGDAVSRISGSIAMLRKCIIRDDDMDYNDALVQLLNNPGEGMSGIQFWRELSESYLLTQEGWIVGKGRITAPPLALVFVRPYNVSVTYSSEDGLPITIQTSGSRDSRIYERVILNGKIRYIDKLQLNEIFPIIGSVSIMDEWRGRSPLVKLFYDLEMSTDGKRHNSAVLKNGMFTSKTLAPKPVKDSNASWSEDIVQKVKDYLRVFHQGAGNSGSVAVFGRPVEITDMTQTNHDMDFLNLLKNSQVSIYNLYKIPLPLILPDTMTLDNYTAAQRAFYTKAVFPVYDEISAGIMTSIGSRFKMSYGDAYLGFDETAIRDMQPVLVENMKQLRESQVVTVNEVRAIGGYEPDAAGDVILVGANQVPLSTVSTPTFGETGGPDTESDNAEEEI